MGAAAESCEHGGVDSARVDRWVWSVRLFPSRSAASEACRAGHVQVNGARAKPAATLKVGDTVRARCGDRERVVEVARLIDSRVGAPIAAACFVDRSPPPPPRDPLLELGRRAPGAGRPSKRDRRMLDRWRS